MKCSRAKSAVLVASLAALVLVSGMPHTLAALEVGVGLSNSTDARAAGVEAATQAKAALGDEQPKLVLVYNSMDLKKPAQIGEMLAGVGSVFDAGIVYGCTGYAPLTQHGSGGTVGLLALAGDFGVTTALAPVEGDDGYRACGKRIGQALKEAAGVDAPGRLLLLFGDCHVPANDDVVKGVCSVLGETFPVVGGSSSATMGVYEKGKFVPKSNLGILLTGDFACRLSIKQDNSPRGLIDSARATLRDAVGEGEKKPAVVFVFDCGGRRGKMLENGNFPEELEAMKEIAGDQPIFGFYGSGEIGCKANDTPACGVGFHISACAVVEK